MTKRRNGLIAALDIGTTKVVCFIARVTGPGELEVVGIGHQVSQGMSAGMITDAKAVETCVLATVNAAEQMAGANIDRVFVNITGGKINSRILHVEVPVNGNQITAKDVNRIINAGVNECQQEGRTIIHCIPTDFLIDGEGGIQDPQGMVGNHLGVKLHLMSVSNTALMNISQCLARCHLDIEDFTVAPYASGLACLTRDEKDLGVTMLDLGGGNTSFCLFRNGKVVYADSLPLGGIHITKDIAYGLATDMANAERIKTLYGNVFTTSVDEQEMIDVPTIDDEWEFTSIPRAMLIRIIRPRVEEIFEMVNARIKAQGIEDIAGSRVVLTGGGSNLLGIKELASMMFGKQARLASPNYIDGLAESTKGPAFSTCVGMLGYARDKIAKDSFVATKTTQQEQKNYYSRMFHWLCENF